MWNDVLFGLALAAAIGCGLIGGVFFAFSAFIMKGLARIAPAQGIAAMQSINVAVLNPWFLSPFFGTAAACVALIVASILRWSEPEAIYQLAGGLLYLLGTFVVTIAFNVQRNNTLAAIDPSSAEGATQWSLYVPSWTVWNTVRTAAALAAATSLTIGLVV